MLIVTGSDINELPTQQIRRYLAPRMAAR